MSVVTEPTIDRIWFARGAAPTATGIAADLGWLRDEFAADGIGVSSLADLPTVRTLEPHFGHRTPGRQVLFREDGSVPALWSRSRGADTRVIGLVWRDEQDAIVTRGSFGLATPRHLLGARVALPPKHAESSLSLMRAAALHAFAGALGDAGLALDDVTFVDVPDDEVLEALRRGDVDAAYVKGGAALEEADDSGAVVLVDRVRPIGRGTLHTLGAPSPITVDRRVLDERPDVVARYLAVLLQAADLTAGDSGSMIQPLHPDLSGERVESLQHQATFLAEHGFVERLVDVEAWADPTPLSVARDLLAGRRSAPGSEGSRRGLIAAGQALPR